MQKTDSAHVLMLGSVCHVIQHILQWACSYSLLFSVHRKYKNRSQDSHKHGNLAGANMKPHQQSD